MSSLNPAHMRLIGTHLLIKRRVFYTLQTEQFTQTKKWFNQIIAKPLNGGIFMRTLIIILFVSFSFTFSSYSQFFWTEQVTGVTVPLTSVSNINALVAWVCGNNGTVIRTTDGGYNWTNHSGNGIPANVPCQYIRYQQHYGNSLGYISSIHLFTGQQIPVQTGSRYLLKQTDSLMLSG
jgi:hypothetical protein